MPTPLADALSHYLTQARASFHTPGHRARFAPLRARDLLALDLTELPGLGALYDSAGDAIEAAETLAARAFGAGLTLFSAGGCTLCIQAMLLLGVPAGGRVLMARNAHRSAIHTAALLGLDVAWAFPPAGGGAETALWQPSAAEIRARLEETPGVSAVYVTSPNYYGVLADIPGIAAVCREFGARGKPVRLLCDNAHGSHLGAFGAHPLALGADMTADSAHKTLPVLTGGAYLHLREGLGITREAAKGAMALFGSTSPGYPVLCSLDLARAWWEEEGGAAFAALAGADGGWTALRRGAASRGLTELPHTPEYPPGRDPARLTLDGGALGLTGEAVGAHSRRHGCEPEYTDGRYAVFLLSPLGTAAELARLGRVIATLPAGTPEVGAAGGFDPFAGGRPAVRMPVREAMLAASERVPGGAAAGRIAARTVCPCPPGIPAAVPGEEVSAEAAAGARWVICVAEAEKRHRRGVDKGRGV